MLKIALCDDDEKTAAQHGGNIEEWLLKQGTAAEVRLFFDAGSLLQCRDVSGALPFDILFLDIEMPGMDGLALAAEIRETDAVLLIIFLTAHERYVYQSFEFQPFRYIPKPRLAQYLPKALRDAVKAVNHQKKENGYYHAVTPQTTAKLPYHTILYAVKQARYVVFHLNNNEKFELRKNIKQVYSQLDVSLFVMIHSGCVVNMKYVREINKPIVTLTNGITFTASREGYKRLRESIHQYWGERI